MERLPLHTIGQAYDLPGKTRSAQMGSMRTTVPGLRHHT